MPAVTATRNSKMSGVDMKQASRKFVIAIATTTIGLLMSFTMVTAALGSQQNPQSGSVGLEGTIPSPPPSQAATIITPTGGQTFTSTPVTINGLCPSGLLVKLFSNNVFAGAVQCNNGSYSIQVDLFNGQNDLVARDYDALDQAGPDSNVVSVTFNDAQFIAFGTRVSLTSNYAKRGANPGQELDWPIVLSGGNAPYAISADWGDGTAADLSSQQFAGDITIKHTYRSAGVYKVVVKATDSKGTTGFLQLVGVGNGQATQATGSTGSVANAVLQTKTSVLWWPAAVMIPLILVAFWLGQRNELLSIRRHLDESRNQANSSDN